MPKKKEEVSKISTDTLSVITEVNKEFGAGTLTRASDLKAKERIPFGVPELDRLTGGIVFGAYQILWGNKSASKTTACYCAIAQAQKKGKRCIFFDMEGSFDSEWAKQQGVDLDTLVLGRFETAEDCMDTVIKVAQEGAFDFIILDSVQAMSPKGEQVEGKAEKQRSVSDDTMALLARKLSQFFRMSNYGIFKNNVAMLLIGQARIDLGAFVKLETLSGGNALAHWATWTVKLRRGQGADAPEYSFKNDQGKKESIRIGFDLVAKLEKTKISGTMVEGAEVHLPFYFKSGYVKPDEATIKQNFLQEIVEEEKVFEEMEKKKSAE
jgi:recombination protein RecA